MSISNFIMRDEFPYLEVHEMMDAMDSVHRYYVFFDSVLLVMIIEQ